MPEQFDGLVVIGGVLGREPGRLRVDGVPTPRPGKRPDGLDARIDQAEGEGVVECGRIFATGRGLGERAAILGGDVDVQGDLDVNGDLDVRGNLNLRGDCIFAEGADYAEALTTNDPAVEPGYVVVLGRDGEVHLCDRDYDTAVAGIVSGARGVRPAIVLDRHERSAQVAMVGKVWCFADAEFGQIEPGDLLTTSSTTGHCRKVTDRAMAFGALVGKALTPLLEGRSLIRVLVTPR